MNKLEIRLAETYQIPGGPGKCEHFDGVVFCGIDRRFCVFLVIQNYLELMSDEKLNPECLTEPKIPNNIFMAWLELRNRKV